MKLSLLGVRASLLFSYAWDCLWSFVWKSAMKRHGKGVIRPMSSLIRGVENLSVGDYSILPSTTTIFCTKAPLVIGRKCIFGPGCSIITGDHRVDVIGKHVFDSMDKLPENDQQIIIEDGVWCGANVTILKGGTIGRGSIVAAGSVVTKSCVPYSIIGGVSAKLIKMRFSEDQVLLHEKILKNNGD